MSETMDQIRLLRTRLSHIGEELGLDMQNFMIVPSDGEHGPDIVQAMFVVRSEAIPGEKDADDLLMEERFKEIALNFDSSDAEAKLDDIKKDLGEWLN